jgi:hypothetical protein
MNAWVLGTYLIFLLAILWGWIACWRSGLPFAQKCFWSAVILIFPMAGTVLYFMIGKESRDILS